MEVACCDCLRMARSWGVMSVIVTLVGAHRCHRYRSATRWTCCSRVDATGPSQGARGSLQTAKRMVRAAPARHGSVDSVDSVAGAIREAAFVVVRRMAVEVEVHVMELPRVSCWPGVEHQQGEARGVLPP